MYITVHEDTEMIHTQINSLCKTLEYKNLKYLELIILSSLISVAFNYFEILSKNLTFNTW